MWAKGLLQNWLAFKFRKCFSPAEWNRSETKRTPSAYWNEICLKDPSPSLKVIPTYIFKNVEMASATPQKCRPALKKHLSRSGRTTLGHRRCCWPFQSRSLFHSKMVFFFFCCRWWHNPPNPVCLHIASFAIITGWLFSTVHYVPSTNSIPQGNAVFSQLHGLCNKPYWRRFMEKINSAIAAP